MPYLPGEMQKKRCEGTKEISDRTFTALDFDLVKAFRPMSGQTESNTLLVIFVAQIGCYE